MPPFAAVAGIAAALAERRRPYVQSGLAVAVAGAALLGHFDRRRTPPSLANPQPVAAAGFIASAPTVTPRGTGAWLEIEALRGVPIPAAWRGARVWCSARQTLPAYGSRVCIAGTLQPPGTRRNFGTPDPGALLRAQGGAGRLEVRALQPRRGERGPAWRRALLEPLRVRLGAALYGALAPREAGLLAALVLGRRDGVDPALDRSWSALGLSHVLSISGMHIALLGGALIAVFGSPSRKRGLVGLLAGVWLYTAVGGFGPTVLRAALMATWAAVAMYLGRARAPLAALGIAALVLVVQAPERRLDLGLQLSCASTGGLLACAPALAAVAERLATRGWRGRMTGWAVATAGLACAAQLATLPLTLAAFGTVPWVAPLANAILVPGTDIALALALVGAPLALGCETLGRPLLLVAGAILHVLGWISIAVSSRFETRWFLPVESLTLVAATALAAGVVTLGLAARGGRRRLARLACGSGLVAIVTLGGRTLAPATPGWQVEALDVGQGDATVLRVGAAAWLVDTGDAAPTDNGVRVVVPHLRRAGVRRLRGLVLSHPHRDHCGGAGAVLAALAVDTVYVARASFADTLYAALRARFPHVPWRGLARGATLQLGCDYAARVVWPESTDVLQRGPNECSLVLAAAGGHHPDLWLCGDLEHEGEAHIRNDSLAWHAGHPFTILKAGHHGSDTSSTEVFLDALQPDLALVSVGAMNRYGHPGRRTLASLAAHGCTIVRTDRGGAVRVVERGATLWIERPAARARPLGEPVDVARDARLE